MTRPRQRRPYIPCRGDIVRLAFDPASGHEQQGTRSALILSPEAFNRFGLALACPITRGGAFARGKAWTVTLPGMATDGVVLCNQAKTLDWKARRAELIEVAPADSVAEVIARVAAVLE